MSLAVIPGLDPSNYPRHAVHGEGSVWVEKNCYVDLWIELLHALRVEPRAVLPFCAAIDFEGDQWTFFKPSHDELRALYGIDVQELNVWRPLLEHAREHLAAGKLICTESDAFWLPDTSGTDYRRQHTKTTIVINDLDVDGRRLGYFHNAGYYRLEGEDFVKTFRLDAAPDPAFMPLFAEVVRIDRLVRREDAELRALSRGLWQRHLARRPPDNPIRRFRERFERDMPEFQKRGLPHYHAWAFGSTRQLGAAFELAAQNLAWLNAGNDAHVERARDAFAQIATTAKSFILKGARLANGKPLDVSAVFDQLAVAWEAGMHAAEMAFGRGSETASEWRAAN
ncbi:MAG TPA: DUF1839 family protein [Steroidobacteraceae bacterium]|nr:DUF1839 family protein [Steroidobacteraceae bacterium]